MTAPSQQKLKVHGPVVVTGNRLSDGAVVYRSMSGWTARLDEALVVSDTQAAKDLLVFASKDDTVVGAYVAPVKVDKGQIEPGNLRERIRLSGPTFDFPAGVGI
jgi:Protein of unknown function (DUF2849)